MIFPPFGKADRESSTIRDNSRNPLLFVEVLYGSSDIHTKKPISPASAYTDGEASRRKVLFPVSNFRQKYLTNIWNVPNVLTMLRLALIPVFVILHAMYLEKLALLTFCVASFTDWLDGHIARKYNLITDFGKLMDPLADKLMVCTALVMQGIRGYFPVVAIIIVIIKELVMIYGSSYMLAKDIVVYAHSWGKLAQCSFILALVLSFWHPEFTAMNFPIDRVCLWIAVVIAIIALVDYTMCTLKTLKGLKAKKAE